MESKPTAKLQVSQGKCWGCRLDSTLYRKYQVDMCEPCLLFVAKNYYAVLPWCGWCEEKVVNLDLHSCSEGTSMDWLDLASKLK